MADSGSDAALDAPRGPVIDAPAGTAIDAPDASPMVDAPSGGTALPLLLTEVVLAPSAGEFIEIANPGSSPVDLSSYYLTDAGGYFRLPGGPPTLEAGDFIVRFPATAMIPAKGVITIALDTAASFTTAYGAAPTYSLASGTMTMVVTNGVASLTNGGELIALVRWDGTSDLVRDVDIVIAGAPTVANGLVDKSGITLDGPDSDTTATAYKTDARTVAAQATAPASGRSTKRTALETGYETQTGAGNGLTGDDETSENTAMTWDTTFTLPTPGTVPTGLLP
ncbi:MAG: uncharacterized protein JWP01_2762 [Myxococcales bacterium]|nr:uncharacterized protein [Myxococcales bacterium]